MVWDKTVIFFCISKEIPGAWKKVIQLLYRFSTDSVQLSVHHVGWEKLLLPVIGIDFTALIYYVFLNLKLNYQSLSTAGISVVFARDLPLPHYLYWLVTLEVQVRWRGRVQTEICGRRQMAVEGFTRGQEINLKSFLLYALTFHLWIKVFLIWQQRFRQIQHL